jgi:predicted RNase H-like HicB family nuclease
MLLSFWSRSIDSNAKKWLFLTCKANYSRKLEGSDPGPKAPPAQNRGNIMQQRTHFPIIIEQDMDGVYIVNCPSFQGCRSYGYTVEQAMDNIREAIQVCIEEVNDHPEASTQFLGIRDLELTL